MTDTYSLLDSGDGKKLERYGPYTIVRPAAQCLWKPSLDDAAWKHADAAFTREGKFAWLKKIAEEWEAEILGLKFRLSSTDFGHLGVFPEQKEQWLFIEQSLKKASARAPLQVLNLFAYSGGATMVATKAGASVCHLDASKGMVAWARENVRRNGLEDKPIRWIVEDVQKFLLREIKRGRKYDAIILDPPTYGRGSKGEVFKFEKDLYPLLVNCKALLSENPLFLLLSCHTPQITEGCLRNVLSQVMNDFKGTIESGEMMLQGDRRVMPVPNGSFARWTGNE